MINPVTVSVVPDGRVVRKTLHRPVDPGPEWLPCDHEDDWNWWKRELLLYATQLSGVTRRGRTVRAPKVISGEHVGDQIVLTTERVKGQPETDLARAARHLGAWQGDLVGVVLQCLAPDWCEGYAAARGAVAPPLPEGPLTVCHGDVWPPNILAGDDGATWLLDWGWAHLGPLGEDLATLLVETLLFGFRPMAEATQLRDTLVTAYSEGASIPEDVALQGLLSGLARKYAWLPTALAGPRQPRWVADATDLLALVA